MTRLLPALAVLLLAGCAQFARRPPAVKSGLDVLAEDGWSALAGKRVGLITNSTGVDSRRRLGVELMASATGFTLAAVLTPEHGFSGRAEHGKAISSGTILAAGRELPMHSLFGGGTAKMRPTPEMLAGLDVLVYDIQDIGARFYTYATTLAMGLEAAKAAGIPYVVLDRPNPIDGTSVQGPLPDEPGLVRQSGIAYLEVPARHGMSSGELALLHNEFVQHAALSVVKMRGWKREMWFDDTGLPWVPTSLNMPDLAAAALYPGLAGFDMTNVSVGRGTPHPFGWIGAPWLDADAVVARLSAAKLDGVSFSRKDTTPSRAVHAGKLCRGVRVRLRDRRAVRPLRVYAHLVAALRDLHPKDFDLHWIDPKRMGETRHLIAVRSFLAAYERGASGAELAEILDPPADEFLRRRRPFLLYE